MSIHPTVPSSTDRAIRCARRTKRHPGGAPALRVVRPRAVAAVGTLAGCALAASVFLGRSADAQLSATNPPGYVYAATIGTANLPWPRSNAYLNQPWGLGADRDGVWVANAAGRNIVRFGTGALEELGRAGGIDRLYGLPARWITDVAVSFAARAPGQVPTPTPTVDPNVGPPPPPQRTIWLADAGADVVVGITVYPNGSQAQPVFVGEYGVPGADDQHLNAPQGVAADPYGNLYVSDTGNHRVLVLGSDLKERATLGVAGQAGSDDAHFDTPTRLAVDNENTLFVADTANGRVQGFDISNPSAPRLIHTYGAGGGAQGLTAPEGLGTDATFVYVADGASGKVQIFQKSNGHYWKTLDGRSAEGCGSASPDDWWDYASDVAVTNDGTIEVALPKRMQVVTCDAFTREPRGGYGGLGIPYVTEEGLYNAPAAVAEASNGYMVIAEMEGHRLVGRDATGLELWTAGTPGVAGAADELSAPSDLAFLPSDQVVVADRGNGRLVVYDRLGRRTAVWGAGTLSAPAGLTVTADGGVAVADADLGRILLFSASGAPAGPLTGATGQPLRFTEPTDVVQDAAQGWYVSDAGADVVRHYAADGTLMATLGEDGVPGDSFDHFDGPHGLALDADGRLLVVDTGNARVEVFGADGSYLTTIAGAWSSGTGGMREPRGVALGVDGRVLVADTYNDRIQAFTQARPPWQPWAVNGMGERRTEAVSALADHAGWLFVGTRGPDGAAVWQRSGSGDWYDSATGGLGDPEQVGVTVFAEHNGALYAGTESRHAAGGQVTTNGGEVWRTADKGSSWQKVAQGGFGVASNAAVQSLASFKGTLYAGTKEGTPTSGPAQPAQLWKSASGDAASWTRVPIELFTRDDWSVNWALSAMTVYSNTLIAGTCSQGGPQIWVSADGAQWRPAGDLAQGGDPRDANPALGVTGSACVTAFTEFNGQLYAGMGNEPAGGGNYSAGGQAEVWRCTVCNGTDWEPAAAPGMGDGTTTGRVALAPFDEPPFSYLYAALGNDTGGMQLWRSDDGLDWEPQLVDGLGDDNNTDVGGGAAMTEHQGRLFVGTRNLANGGELWSSPGGRPGVVPTPPGATPSPTPRPLPQPPVGRARYVKAMEWPTGAVAAADVIGAPVDMAVADDGTVYLLDSAPVRVLRLAPDGQWLAPFGGTGSGADRITRTDDNGLTAAIAVSTAANRVYVSDLGTERVLIYDLQGHYLESWDEIAAVDLDPRTDGSVWVADVLGGAVRRLDATGKELERVGEFSPDDDFGLLRLVQVAEDTAGRLWIADMNGNRLRVYDKTGGAWRRIRTLDLTTGGRAGCPAQRLQALGDDLVLSGACVIDQSQVVNRVPANHGGSDLYGTNLRTANLGAHLYYAMATYDIDRLNPDNPTYPAVVKYFDDGFDIVVNQWRGEVFAANTAAEDAVLNPVRLSTAPDGSLYLSDDLGLRRFSPEGRVMDVLATQAYPSRSTNLQLDPRLLMGTGEPGKIFGVGTAATGRRQIPSQLVIYGNTVQRRRCVNRVCQDGLYVEPVWDAVMEAGLRRVPIIEYNYAVAHEPTKNQLVLLQLWIDNASQIEFPARLLLFPAGDMGRKTQVDLPDTDRQALWTDVDAGRDGRILVLDTLKDRVAVFDADGHSLGMVDTPKDAWRVAAGPNGEIYVLTTYGHVVRMAPDGTVLSRFIGLPNASVPFTAQVDLAVDDAGRVFIVDDLYQQVTVFEPEGTEADVLEGNRCTLAGDKWVAPTDILLGQSADLFLSLFGTCGYQEEPADIVLAVAAPPNQDIQNLQVARQILGLIDTDVHRVGIVSFVVSANVESKLTHNRDALILALMSVPSPRPTGCGVNTQAAIRASKDVFEDAPGRKKVLIIIRPPTDPTPGRCAWDRVSIADEAAPLKADGTVIVAVNGPQNPPTVAASSEVLGRVQVAPRGTGVGRPALRRSITRVWPDSLISSGTLTDTLPANIDYVAGSAAPPAAWDPASRTLTWQLKDLARAQAHRFSLRITPREEGLWPTNVESVANATDGWGNAVRTVLPIPKIRVYGEIPPTATPFPIVTPGPSPTPRPTGPLYLPVVLRTQACTPFTRNADVAMVLDTSGSMSDPTTPGGVTKFDAAKAAAATFLGNLVAGRDQAALIQFNSEATVLVHLTDVPADVIAGLDLLTQAPGTRIDLALKVAHAELASPAHRPRNNPVLILLTDGEPSGTTPEDVLAEAAAAKADGDLIFTIGLGQDVDHDLLRSIASQPDWYFPAPDTSDLAAIYEQIAYSIPCKPEWP